MTEDEYVACVRDILSLHTKHAVEKVHSLLPHVPPQATEMHIQISVDQGVEGFLTVSVGLIGPDLYVLNKGIRPYRVLFDTIMLEDRLEPDLPLMDIHEDTFSVGDVLTDCGAAWAAKVWEQAETTACQIPVLVTSPEEYGTSVPMKLQ